MKQTNPLKNPLTSKEILHKHKKASELEKKQKELLLEKIKELFQQKSHIYFKEPPWDREFKIKLEDLPINSLMKILDALPFVPNANKDFHKNFLR